MWTLGEFLYLFDTQLPYLYNEDINYSYCAEISSSVMCYEENSAHSKYLVRIS